MFSRIVTFLKKLFFNILSGILASVVVIIIGKYWWEIIYIYQKINWITIFATLVAIILTFIVIVLNILIWKNRKKFKQAFLKIREYFIPPHKDGLRKRNPFKYGSPVLGEDFYNRVDEIDKIYNHLSRGESCSIVSNRRVGKTSILRHISNKSVVSEICRKHKINPRKDKFIFLNVAKFSNEEEFWKRLCDDLKQIIKIESNKALQANIHFENFEVYIKHLDQKGFRIWILLDEFDSAMGKMTNTFFDRLLALPGEYNVAYVTTTTRSLSEYTNQRNFPCSPFFSIFHEIYLGLFSNADSKSLLSSLFSRGEIFVSDNNIKFLLSLAGLHPFFLQIVGYIFFENYISSSDHQDRKALYQKIKEDFINKAKPYFQYYIDHLTREEWSALIDLANNKKIENELLRALQQRVLIHKIKDNYVPLSESFQEYVLEKSVYGYAPLINKINNYDHYFPDFNEFKPRNRDMKSEEIKIVSEKLKKYGAEARARYNRLKEIDEEYKKGMIDIGRMTQLKTTVETEFFQLILEIKAILTSNNQIELSDILDKIINRENKENVQQALLEITENKGLGKKLLNEIKKHKDDVIDFAVKVVVELGKKALIGG